MLNGWINRLERAARYMALTKLNAAVQIGIPNKKLMPAFARIAAGDLNVQNKHYAAAIANYHLAWQIAEKWAK